MKYLMKNIRNILCLSVLIFGVQISYSQCNCSTMYQEDLKISTCNPSPINFEDRNLEPALSVVKVGEEIMVVLTIRCKTNYVETDSDLKLLLHNGEFVVLEFVAFQKAYLEDSKVVHAKYVLTNEKLEKFKKSNLKSLIILTTDGVLRTFPVKLNSDCLKTQLNCI